MENQVETLKYTPEKAKQNALAKLDLIRKWQEFRRKAVNKLQADYDFVKLHNSSNSYLFNVLGKISRGSLHRWKASLDGTEDYTRLIPNYKYDSINEYRTCLTDEEIKIFMGLLLHPNRICIGKANVNAWFAIAPRSPIFATNTLSITLYNACRIIEIIIGSPIFNNSFFIGVSAILFFCVPSILFTPSIFLTKKT